MNRWRDCRQHQAEAEAERRAQAEAEAKRKAQAAAEAKRQARAKAEAKREAQAAAKAKRKAQAEAEAKRKAQAEAEAWLCSLVLVMCGRACTYVYVMYIVPRTYVHMYTQYRYMGARECLCCMYLYEIHSARPDKLEACAVSLISHHQRTRHMLGQSRRRTYHQ